VKGQLLPLIAGTLAILGFAVYLAAESPSPGPLARRHAALAELGKLPGCERCHAAKGLDEGCLGCHEEIREQRDTGTGYHREVRECAACHPEHNGKAFDLMEAVAWTRGTKRNFHARQPSFGLRKSHDALACGACHAKPRTYLGLDESCATCHDEVHEGGDFADCKACHDQAAFKPATRFDHAAFFELQGAHAKAACGKCHTSFKKARGKRCRECHASPHETDWGKGCEACHAADAANWSEAAPAFTPALHARTGFALEPPHDRVECAKCHIPRTPYADRFQKRESCRACHEDEHAGQFANRGCLDCHAAERFVPSKITTATHATFALDGAHARADCKACHAQGRFANTPRDCRGCHEDVHEGQFKQQACSKCHTQERFRPARYDLAGHAEFPIMGAHRAVTCRACHTQETQDRARRFVGTPRRCEACHTDPHGSQFAKEKRCEACHRADAATFRIAPFDHAQRTGYRLEGAHAKADCSACHRTDKSGVRRYRKTPADCSACHTDVHRAQFLRKGEVRCDRCHLAGGGWSDLEFDHNRMSRFPLDKTHVRVACASCHLPVPQPDKSRVIGYRPIGRECRDCHEIQGR